MLTSDLSYVYKWSKSLKIGNSYVYFMNLITIHKGFSNEFTQKSKCKLFYNI